jgi:formate hydrogenlyase transcriptional activator
VPDDLNALRAVVEGTAAGTGQEFFRSLVRHLAEAIDVHYAAVCEVTDAPRGRAIAIWERDHVVEDLPFDFSTSPSAEVLCSGLAHFPTRVLQAYPEAKFLADRNVDGYMAVPFHGGAGNVIGFLSVFDERPMPPQPRRLFILQIFAARAAAEFERLRAERKQRESEARYRHLYESAPSGYLTLGTDLRVLEANRRATELLGYPIGEIVGAHVNSLLPNTPAGKAQGEEMHHKHLAGEAVSGRELEMRRKDGSPLWVNLWMEGGRNEDGTIQPARAIFVDVTDRVLAEQERESLRQQKLYLQEEINAVHNFEQIIGRSAALREVLNQVARVAPTDATVLITGETGTGKELIARAIHSASKRRDKPLIKVNCAALPSGLVESELFGHEKGAFSGAVAKRLGRFELADGGTIFLDEIGELPADAQVKLLRVLQEREFERVGGGAPIRVNVRVIAATNRDLLGEVRDRAFREDLYYRLNVFPIRLPPLRDRCDDIPLLAHFLLNKFAPRVGKQVLGLSPQTMRRLQDYAWPGNIRELENVLERALILASGDILEIGPDVLPATPRSDHRAPPPDPQPADQGSAAPAQPAQAAASRRLRNIEHDHILRVLRETNWIVTGPKGAAHVLGLNPSTLRSRMKKLGILRDPE